MFIQTSGPLRALFACGLWLGATTASAEQPVLPRVLDACRAELEAYCSKITPGDGRLIACLYANEDQLSRTCDYQLFDAAVELQNMMGALSRVAEVCEPDIELLCGKDMAGEGRVAKCLRRNQMALSAPCHDAIEETGIDVR